MSFILLLFLLCLATEAVTQLLTQSEIFNWLSDWAQSGEGFFQRMFRCGYCTSVWISGGLCILTSWLGLFPYWWLFLLIPSVHRLSNWLHHIFELLNQSAMYLKEYNDRQGIDY